MTIPLGSKFYVRPGAGYTWREKGEEHCELPGDARPLIVIDPEDREAVERLGAAFSAHCGWTSYGSVVRAERLQAALREYANPKPPKPAEPKWVGSVVRDADGGLWVNATDTSISEHKRPWMNLRNPERWADYDEIDVAEWLTTGVRVE